MPQYVALLRGINVGGKNLIRMAALKACFESEGFGDVTTYIQSGNVLFRSARSAREGLTGRIERMLAAAFRYDASVVLRDRKQMTTVVHRAPARFRYDVIFLKEPLAAAEAIRDVPTRDGVDQAHAGTGVLYFSRLIAKASRSQLSRIVSLPMYQHMTIRNWNTTTTLLEMMDATG
jgi:uncharacterized protein (DUF1697 family)